LEHLVFDSEGTAQLPGRDRHFLDEAEFELAFGTELVVVVLDVVGMLQEIPAWAQRPQELSQSYLGAQYRRLKNRLGAPKAITAMARKLAFLFYRLLKHGQQYVDKGWRTTKERYREQ
jgi:hypothetical protein